LVLNGDLKPNPADVPGTASDADFTDPDNCSAPDRRGCQLDVNHIASATFGVPPVTDFNVTIGKPTVAAAGNFISARCHDGDHKWNLRTMFTYTDPAPPPPDQVFQTVPSSQTCS
jgi:hypothetical protein